MGAAYAAVCHATRRCYVRSRVAKHSHQLCGKPCKHGLMTCRVSGRGTCGCSRQTAQCATSCGGATCCRRSAIASSYTSAAEPHVHLQIERQGDVWVQPSDGAVCHVMRRRYVLQAQCADASGQAYLQFFNDQVPFDSSVDLQQHKAGQQSCVTSAAWVSCRHVRDHIADIAKFLLWPTALFTWPLFAWAWPQAAGRGRR